MRHNEKSKFQMKGNGASKSDSEQNKIENKMIRIPSNKPSYKNV